MLKLRVPETWRPEELAKVPLALSQNVANRANPLAVNAVAADLLTIGEALGQGEATARWLQTVAPFDPFISYLAANWCPSASASCTRKRWRASWHAP